MLCTLLSIFAIGIALFQWSTYLLLAYEIRSRDGVAEQLARPGALASAWLQECVALAGCLLLWLVGWLPATPKPLAGTGRPVVLIHGWGMNRAVMWPLAARLRRAGRAVYSVSYQSTGPDMGRKAREVAHYLRQVLLLTSAERVDVVGHSLGGLVIREVARFEDGLDYLGNVVTLGSPHRGTKVALLGTGELPPLVRPGSQYLERLADGDDVPQRLHFTSIYSTFDAMVFPTENAHYPGAFNVEVGLLGHSALLFSERVAGLVLENLDYKASDSPEPAE